jgi:hypothetical protein
MIHLLSLLHFAVLILNFFLTFFVFARRRLAKASAQNWSHSSAAAPKELLRPDTQELAVS